MSEASAGLDASDGCHGVGPDYFGFYARQVTELMLQDEDYLPYSTQLSSVEKNTSRYNFDIKDNKPHSAFSSLFLEAIGSGHSDHKKERLKALLKQSIVAFTQEVNEVLHPIVSMCRIKSFLQPKKSLCRDSDGDCEEDTPNHPSKKVKSSSPLSSACTDPQFSDDLQYLLHNKTKVERTMKKHSDEFSKTLVYMEQKIEELLNVVVSSCRTMTCAEKQQLRRMIQKLPQGNLDRVVEIVQCSKPSEEYTTREILVDLEKEDNLTLWRLYYFVKTVENATRSALKNTSKH